MRPNDTITLQSVFITAADAAEFLQKNINNRPKRTKLVEKYCDMMLGTLALRMQEDDETAPPWRWNLPFAVMLDTEDNIQNSQHCLSALEMCEQKRALEPEKYGTRPLEVAAIIAEGIQPVDADLLDTGAGRSHQDVLFRKHLFESDEFARAEFTESDMKKMAKTLSTAAKIVWLRVEHGKKLRASVPFDHSIMTRIVDYNPGLIESVAYIHMLDKEVDQASGKAGGVRSVINPAYAAAAHYLAWHSQLRESDGTGMKRTMADGFFKAFGTGKSNKTFEEGCPALACRTYLSRLPAKKDNDVLEGMFDALVLAWNATKDAKNSPLSPKSPFKVSRKDHPDGMVWMGGLDTKPEPPATEEAPESDVPPAEPEQENEQAQEPAIPPAPPKAVKAPPAPPKLTAAQKADAAALKASGKKAPPKPIKASA